MKKSHNFSVDVNSTDYLDLTRRLYRGVTDIAKKLDDHRAAAVTIQDLFTASEEILRTKLKDYCERLIFHDPVGHAKKIEELLWRRAFYDVVSTAKKLRQGNVWNEVEKALLSTHLSVGVGFYHHLILKLQLECNLDIVSVDLISSRHDACLLDNDNECVSLKFQSKEAQQCVIRLIHRSLICLGDLTRYKIDLDPNWDPMIAMRYYKMAIGIDPNIGMPHNQLGTISGNKNYGVDAVYYYMRCILCPESFDGAEGNLQRIISAHLFTGKEKLPSQRCAAKLFSLFQKWNNDLSNSNRVNEDCEDLLMDIKNCLNTEKIEENKPTLDKLLQHCKLEQNSYLSDDVVFKMIAICLMSILKLREKESSQVHAVIAFILSLLSQLIQVVIDNLQEFMINLPHLNGQNNGEHDYNNGLINEEDNVEAESALVCKDNNTPNDATSQNGENCVDVNENTKKVNGTESNIQNGHSTNGDMKKPRSKPKKNLLSKLRRPRKYVNSSDSDASDFDGPYLDTSGEEMNSDLSDTDDEDGLSDCILSDNLTDDDVHEEEEENSDAEVGVELNGAIKAIEPQESQKDEVKDDVNVSESISAVSVRKYDSGISIEQHSKSNTTVDQMVILKKQTLNSEDLLKVLSKKELLYSIKICFDWLRGNPDIIKMVAKSSRMLLHRISILLNLINVDTEALLKTWDGESIFLTNSSKLNEYVNIVPLREDNEMRGLQILQTAHQDLNWHILRKYTMRKREETLLRILKLNTFGKYLCSIEEVGMKFDEDQNIFLMTDPKPIETSRIEQMNDENKMNPEQVRGKLMRHMGRLWLKAEVSALENRLRSKLMSPYLVPDHEALTKYTPVLKRLVFAKKFIVIIPSVVVSALDEMKKTSGRAREAIRWLENQLQKGSRFLRAQRPHERTALPYIKGPRPKDKEAWVFFQIVECCYYFTQQNKVGLNNESPVVTLLTGTSPAERKMSTFNADGLIKTAGVNLEHIQSFYMKWKTSSKSHG
ncbi:protein SMG5 [Chelonus insularis]|uniref:protein SMG5 n=1 Tax=Chelonus insularis TaxID=460826 RepID=UPI00158C9B10|nr:protein SMG5 [Chelonus insularis]